MGPAIVAGTLGFAGPAAFFIAAFQLSSDSSRVYAAGGYQRLFCDECPRALTSLACERRLERNGSVTAYVPD